MNNNTQDLMPGRLICIRKKLDEKGVCDFFMNFRLDHNDLKGTIERL
ncbi:hypothetical protein ACFL4D_00700 [Candidatus Margulisiibacteriota bacterium]